MKPSIKAFFLGALSATFILLILFSVQVVRPFSPKKLLEQVTMGQSVFVNGTGLEGHTENYWSPALDTFNHKLWLGFVSDRIMAKPSDFSRICYVLDKAQFSDFSYDRMEIAPQFNLKLWFKPELREKFQKLKQINEGKELAGSFSRFPLPILEHGSTTVIPNNGDVSTPNQVADFSIVFDVHNIAFGEGAYRNLSLGIPDAGECK